jgi:hypothetical protein
MKQRHAEIGKILFMVLLAAELIILAILFHSRVRDGLF